VKILMGVILAFMLVIPAVGAQEQEPLVDAPPLPVTVPQDIEEQVREIVTFGECSVLWSESIEGGVKMVMSAPDQGVMYDLLFEIGESLLFKKPEIRYTKNQEDGVKFEWTVLFTKKVEDAAFREEELERLKKKMLATVGK